MLISIFASFAVVGSPSTLRVQRLDRERVGDLVGLQHQIATYFQRKRSVPDSLEQLNDPLEQSRVPADPETAAPYEYKKTSDVAFTLCTVFGLPQPEADRRQSRRYTPVDQTAWPHEAGRTCFDRTIDPDKYPPLKGGD